MIRAAIVGLGRWGRSLVTSVQGKSGDIRFVAGGPTAIQAALAPLHSRPSSMREFRGNWVWLKPIRPLCSTIYEGVSGSRPTGR